MYEYLLGVDHLVIFISRLFEVCETLMNNHVSS